MKANLVDAGNDTTRICVEYIYISLFRLEQQNIFLQRILIQSCKIICGDIDFQSLS